MRWSVFASAYGSIEGGMELSAKDSVQLRSEKFVLRDFKPVKALYKEAFPKDERLPLPLLWLLSKKKKEEARVYLHHGEVVGMTFTIDSKETCFLFYIAIASRWRSRGYGSEILRNVVKRAEGKPVSLFIETMDDLDAPNYAQRKRRLAYYEKNGFVQTGWQVGVKKPELDVLSNASDFSLEQGKALVKGTPFKLFQNGC